MKTHTLRVDRVTAELEPHDKRYQVYNPFHPSFYVVPTEIVVEFDRSKLGGNLYDAILTATITGQRYRSLSQGVKAVGPGRGNPSEPTTWTFPTARSMPEGLIGLIRDVSTMMF